MRVVWKYSLLPAAKQVIELPESNVILTVAKQGDSAQMWVQVDTDSPKVPVTIEMFETGQMMPTPHLRQYLGTLQFMGGAYILHVFKRTE